jgi:hypothetical protein
MVAKVSKQEAELATITTKGTQLYFRDWARDNGASAMLSSKLIKGAKLKVYKGAPHGMCTTLKDKVNEDLLAFCKEPAAKA